MAGENQPGTECAEFDNLLAEALDGTLAGERLASFRAHQGSCPLCGSLFAEAEAGRRWLLSLPQVEPPGHLVHNILAATTGGAEERATVPPRPSWGGRLSQRVAPWLAPALATMRQPRFAMSFSMVFFSLSIVLNLAGVTPKDLRRVDLRPRALARTYYETSARVVRYYENLRFVYEIESRMRELKRATTSEEPARQKKGGERKENNSSTPEQRQEHNYSRDEGQSVLASAPCGRHIAAWLSWSTRSQV